MILVSHLQNINSSSKRVIERNIFMDIIEKNVFYYIILLWSLNQISDKSLL